MTVHRHDFYYFTPNQENNIFNSILISNNRKKLTYNNLSDEVLQEVFGCVWLSVGDAAIATVTLVCSRWKAIHGLFRCRVHFTWLSTVHDWEKVSPAGI